METLFSSQCGFPRDSKPGQFKTSPVSSLSSPSATSYSSSSGSQDDLLPELWLESPGRDSTNQGAPFAVAATAQYPHHLNFSNPFSTQGTRHPSPFQSEEILHADSLEYARSLLPHSLLFPLTENSFEDFKHDSNYTAYNYSSVVEEPKRSRGSDASFKKRSPASRHSSVSSSTSSNASTSSGTASQNHGHGHGKHLNTQLYKTELCVSYMKSGACPYGEKCQFAHGEKELKAVNRPSNWRSKPCANWARYGTCRYSIRCCFKHGD